MSRIGDRDTESRGRQALDFIRSYIEVNGYPPSRREIAENNNLRSSSAGQRIIDHLVEKGLIEVNTKVSRGIRIVRGVAETESM